MAKINILSDVSQRKSTRVKRKGVHAKTKTSTSKNSKLYNKRKVGQG